MLLEELIHAFWRDSTPLCSAVAPERFFTGAATVPAVPCVVLIHEKSETLFHTNRADPWKKIDLSFEIRHGDFERGIEIARLVEESFDRLRLREPDGRRSYLFRLVQGENRPEDDGWIFVRKFRLIG